MEKINLTYFEAYYDDSVDAIIQTWKKEPTSEEFREGMNLLIELMNKNSTGALLSNTTSIGAISPEDQEWSYTDWLQRALTIGYHSFAVIISTEIFAQMSVEDVLSEVETGESKLKTQHFNSEEKAREWLATIKKTEKV